jgi:sulfur-oxidizing protein SoxX
VKKIRSFHATIAGLATAAALCWSAVAEAEIMSYEIEDGVSIPKSLTGQPGDAKRGREVAVDRKKGNCLACHKLPIPEQPFHGETAPDLAGVGANYSEGELRLRIVNPKVLNPDTMMPAFYRTDGLHRVMEKFQDKTILSAQDVEDVIAYLMTLK